MYGGADYNKCHISHFWQNSCIFYAGRSGTYGAGAVRPACGGCGRGGDRADIGTRDFSEYSDSEAFMQLIRNERGRELCFESLRKYDLIRWGIFVDAMQDYIDDELDPDWGTGNTAALAAQIARNVQARHVLLPIPSIELGVNTALRQNSLWR